MRCMRLALPPPPTCQQASTVPLGVATTRSSTTRSGQAAAATPRTAAASASFSAGVAGTGSCTHGTGGTRSEEGGAGCSERLRRRRLAVRPQAGATGATQRACQPPPPALQACHQPTRCVEACQRVE